MIANHAARGVVLVAVGVGTVKSRRRRPVIADHRRWNDDGIVAGAWPVHGVMDNRIVARAGSVQWRSIAGHRGVVGMRMVVAPVVAVDVPAAAPLAVAAVYAAAVTDIADMIATVAEMIAATVVTAMRECGAAACRDQQSE